MKKIIYVFLTVVIIYLLLCFVNSYFGWYGYQQWKYRRESDGDKAESVKRKAFISDLNYKSNLDLTYFSAFIEKGYRCDYHSIDDTRFINDTKYPYQVSLKKFDSIVNGVFTVVNPERFDSINNEILNTCIYLNKPYIKDTIVIKISKFDRSNDSIGYIKIWNK